MPYFIDSIARDPFQTSGSNRRLNGSALVKCGSGFAVCVPILNPYALNCLQAVAGGRVPLRHQL